MGNLLQDVFMLIGFYVYGVLWRCAALHRSFVGKQTANKVGLSLAVADDTDYIEFRACRRSLTAAALQGVFKGLLRD
jgi:hypothetical protein